MEGKKMNPIVRALLMAVAVFAICMGVGYVRNVVIGEGAFEPKWAESAVIAFAAGVGTYFGSNAAQRKRNR